MSDEEKKAIEIIKFLQNKCIQENGTGMMPIYRIDDLANAIKILLNLIEKQSKEIEELKKPKYVINCKTNEITKLTNDFVSKDKIKAKILECRKILYSFEKELELKANKEKYIHKESMNCLLSQISILQSLLEKE